MSAALGKWCKLDGDHDFLAKAALLIRIQDEGAREALVGLHLTAGDEPLPSVVKTDADHRCIWSR